MSAPFKELTHGCSPTRHYWRPRGTNMMGGHDALICTLLSKVTQCNQQFVGVFAYREYCTELSSYTCGGGIILAREWYELLDELLVTQCALCSNVQL